LSRKSSLPAPNSLAALALDVIDQAEDTLYHKV
jgi:hypothetical protein